MKRVAAGLSRNVGLEGAFLLAGIAALAVFSTSFSPSGPWLVVGATAMLLGLALLVPARRPSTGRAAGNFMFPVREAGEDRDLV